MPIEILMPALSPTMEEGTLAKWMVKEGDSVNSGDVLAEIETDKATMEVESIDEGIIARILVAEGTEAVKVNAPIALLLEEGEDASALQAYTPGATPAPSPDNMAPSQSVPPQKHVSQNQKVSQDQTSPQVQPVSPTPNTSSHQKTDTGRIKASPLARRLAQESGLDLSTLSGSGPHGRIIKADIDAALSAPSSPQPIVSSATSGPSTSSTEVGMPLSGGADYLTRLGIEPGTYDLIPLDGMRRTIAKRLSESNINVPDFPLTIECEIDELLAMRKELNAQAPEGIKISVNDMLIRASALALRAVPDANASFTPEGIAVHRHADIAVAVAIDGGLITPIIRQAENKGLSVISAEMKDLAHRARERKLKPHEYQGGTFSISNLGMFGIREFGSIINEPQGMILSVGAGAPAPVVKDGALAVATVMRVTLTCDHRVVDGALGASWLQHFERFVEKPLTMML